MTASREKPPVIFTWAGFWRGARQSYAPLISGLPFGLIIGMTGQSTGLSLAETTLMSGALCAGAAQLVLLSAWSHPPHILTLAFAAFAVNLRMALMGPVLAPWFERLRGWRVWLSMFLMNDQNWALSLREMNSGYRDAAYLMGGGVIMYLAWLTTTVLGYLAGSALHVPANHPLFFAALAIFVSTLALMWRGLGDAMPWVVAICVAMAVSHLFPGTFWHIVAGALAGSVAGGLRDRARQA